MKKIYVKPEAFSVAFAVNENIAFSGEITMSSGTEVKYIQSYEGCNKFLMETIGDRKDPIYGTDLLELAAILAKIEKDKGDFVCAGPNFDL